MTQIVFAEGHASSSVYFIAQQLLTHSGQWARLRNGLKRSSVCPWSSRQLAPELYIPRGFRPTCFREGDYEIC